MIRRILSLAIAVVIAVSAAIATVSASGDGNDSGWIELLETTSVAAYGSNKFTISGTSGNLKIDLQKETKLRKVDILLWNPTGQRPTSATITAAGKTNTLEIFGIGSNMTRIVGYAPDTWYNSITVSLKKSTSTAQQYEVLSFKVSPVGVQEFVCDASVYIEGWGTYGINQHIFIEPTDISEAAFTQIRIDVKDWYKYDTLTIWGSAQTLGITAIRASLDTLGLPFTVSYFQTLPTGETTEYMYDYRYNENYSGGGGYGSGYGDTSTAIEYGAKTLFCITIDLHGVDRTLTTSTLVCYITGTYYGLYGYTFNCQYANGSIKTAETEGLTWWNRFTSYMGELFNPDTTEVDEFGNEAEQKAEQMDDLNNQLQSVSRPNVNSIQTDVSTYISPQDMFLVTSNVSSLMNHQMILIPVMISLTIALVAYILYGKR